MTDKSLEDWIRDEALPVDRQSDDAFNARIDQFAAGAGAAVDLLGLGEARHDNPEILRLRNRLFRRLVTRHGFRAVAIESSFPRSKAVNAFVTGENDLSYEALQDDAGFSHGFGRLAGNRELFEWMRQHNANLAGADKIHFYGFDGPTDMATDSPRQLLSFALDYLSGIDSAAAAGHRSRIEPLLGEDARWDNPEFAMNPALAFGVSPEAAALRLATENLISDLNERRPALVPAQGIDRYLEAVHDAAAARHLLNYHAVLAQPAPDRQGRLLSIRAVMMADNLSYIAARELPRGKVLVFANNTHLQRAKVEWQFGSEQVHWWPVGAHLGVLFGARYAVIPTP